MSWNVDNKRFEVQVNALNAWTLSIHCCGSKKSPKATKGVKNFATPTPLYSERIQNRLILYIIYNGDFWDLFQKSSQSFTKQFIMSTWHYQLQHCQEVPCKASDCSTVVEYSPYHLYVEGSSSAATAGFNEEIVVICNILKSYTFLLINFCMRDFFYNFDSWIFHKRKINFLA